jgi:3-oxo-5alpha-steroid 4-dehydrogenase
MFYAMDPLPPLRVDPEAESWHMEVDVAVIGFGGAGVCAALAAAERGAQVAAIERFDGGGATAISGGIVYAGGGTQHQRAAGFAEESPEQMRAYLRHEVGDAVSADTLQRFCSQSVANLEWLESHGVRFSGELCPVKTSYPLDRYTLYYSGNELSPPYRDDAVPAPRGHRPTGKGLPGANLYEPLRRAAKKLGVAMYLHSVATALCVDERGRVIGLQMSSLRPGSLPALWHGALHRWAKRIAPFAPRLAARFRAALVQIERRHGIARRVRARAGVVLAAGGFVMNRPMVAEFAPQYRPGMPLGHTGCDGSGIRLGAGAGALLGRMDRVSAWRFINPPAAFMQGMIVDKGGRRYVNEALYGATIGQAMVEQHDGQAILIIDQHLWRVARSQSRPGAAQWFQWVPALLNLYTNCRRAADIRQLGRICGIDPDALSNTLAQYNACASGEQQDAFGKDRELMRRLEPPFVAINCSLNARRFPCPTLSLGGLRVDERTGQVLGQAGAPIGGLYAAGRNAVGISSERYVSGLSIADCVFSGRRAGTHAAAVARAGKLIAESGAVITDAESMPA